MADHALGDFTSTLRGDLITRDKEEAFRAARLRGWNGDLNTRAKPLAFVAIRAAIQIAVPTTTVHSLIRHPVTILLTT